MREHGLEPRLFCGGGWYIDEGVAAVLAELDYADCTGTAFVPSYLGEDAPRLSAESRSGSCCLTGNGCSSCRPRIRSAWRRGLPPAALSTYVHVYFHDTDLLSAKRRAALRWALAVVARRCEVTDLERLREASKDLSERTFSLN